MLEVTKASTFVTSNVYVPFISAQNHDNGFISFTVISKIISTS